MGQLFAPRAFGSKKCVVRAFVVRPVIHSANQPVSQPCFSFSSAEASRNLGFLRGIVITITYSKSMDQPGEVANPARGQLNKEKIIFLCPRSRLKTWSRETGSAVPSRISLLTSILRHTSLSFKIL